MARRPALALVRPRALPGGVTLDWERIAVYGLCVLAALAVCYLLARMTPVFAVSELDVQGAPPPVRAEVEAAADHVLGASLVGLDGDELVQRLEALPSVRAVGYDRAFPHTLRIAVVPERPLASIAAQNGSWLVSVRGRVIRRIEEGKGKRYPRIRLARALQPGSLLADRPTLTGLAALGQLPRGFPVRVRSVETAAGGLTLVLAGGAELRLGEATSAALKLAVAARVLDSLSEGERASLAYLDLSLPERPVAADKPQV
jgi:cell division septal protein FtsQ